MKTILFFSFFTFLSSEAFAQSFVSPIGFIENEENKVRVIAFIEKQVLEDYSAIGIDDPVTLRMMEEENMKAFKELIKVTNIDLLDDVIKTYCEIGMCNYVTILLMYNEQSKASKEKLKWK